MDTEETQGTHVLTPKPGAKGDGSEDPMAGTSCLLPAYQDTNGNRSHRPGTVQVPLASMHGPQDPLFRPTMASREGAASVTRP